MSDIIEQIEHPFWGRALRLEGYEGWHSPIVEKMPDGSLIHIRVEFDDPDDSVVQENFTAIQERWAEVWLRILNRTSEMKNAYDYGHIPIRSDSDWFELKPPTERIDEGAEWSVMLQADEAGWLLDFRGWADAGGQGVF